MKKFLILILFILITAASLLGYNYKRTLEYKYYTEKGNMLLAQKNYNNALDSYKKAVSYKNDLDIDEKIKAVSKLQESMIKYNSAADLMNNQEYDKALKILKTISDFEDVNDKIKKCQSIIISQKIDEAENYIKQKNYEEAKNILKSAASIDNENEEVKKLIKSCDGILNKYTEDNRKDLLKSLNGVYKLLVEIETQHVYIYKYNKLIKTMVCSSGMSGYDTPEGKFKVTDRGKYFYSDKYQEGAYYWVRFYKSYLFHSVPYDKNGNMIESEADKLGQPASHGCIRLSNEDAKWIYENIPRNISRVLVY